MHSRLLAGLATLFLIASPTLSPAIRGAQNPDQVARQNEQREPHMATALEHLRQAQEELQRASATKGGHREKALQLTQQAIAQVEQGIQYYNTHKGR
jgi:hypothetical protein